MEPIDNGGLDSPEKRQNMTAVPKSSIITVTYNSAEILKSHWASFDSDSSLEWIVVDNASQDDSVAVAEELGARVISLDVNRGFSTANNRGDEISRGKYLFFVNPDVVVDRGTIDVLENELMRSGGLVAPQLVDDRGRLQPNGRGYPYLSWKIRHRLPFRWEGITKYRIFANKDEVVNVSWLTGAVVGVKSADFKLLNGWNESFFLYYEDTDLSLRAHSMGMPVRVLGNVQWTHSWARETAGFSIRPWARELSSASKFYRRYPRYLRVKF